MRVLWLIKGLGPGGAERLLVHHAAGADHDVLDLRAAYLVPWKDHLVGDLAAAGVEVTCLHGERAADLRWAARLRRLLRDDPVDVVHVHSPLVAAVARLVVRSLPRAQRPRLVSTEHNRWPRHRPGTRLANRCTIGLDDVRLAVSDDVRRSMPARWQPGVEVLEHGVPLEELRSSADREGARSELGLGPDDVVLGCVANLRREKAHDDLLAAVDLARTEAPRLRVLSVGQGPLAAAIEARHAQLGLGDRLLLLGHRTDAVRVLSACDALVLSSHHEGLPVAIMEARALGLPVIATAVGGVPSAVRDGVDGLLVPAAQPEQLAAAMIRFVGDDELRAELTAGAAGERDRFDAAVAIAHLEAIYVALAGRPWAASSRS